MYRTLFCNDICDKHIGNTVQLAGWVDVVRDHGGVIFIDLRDYTGVTQVVVHDEDLLKNVNRETVISVSGIVEKRALALPLEIKNVIKCKNPRCITSIEQELDQVFLLTDPAKEVYRCKYCEEKYSNPARRTK